MSEGPITRKLVSLELSLRMRARLPQPATSAELIEIAEHLEAIRYTVDRLEHSVLKRSYLRSIPGGKDPAA